MTTTTLSAAATTTASNNGDVANVNVAMNKQRVLAEIVSESSSSLETVHNVVTCGNSSLKVFGLHPAHGSEAGGTPVAIAVQSINNDTFDSSLFSCKFGDESSSTLEGSGVEVEAQLQRIFLVGKGENENAANAFDGSFEVLVCNSPPYPVTRQSAPGPVSFAITCGGEDDDASSNNGQSILSFEYTMAASVHSIHPTAGGEGTVITIKGGGFRNSYSLGCFFGSNTVVKAEFLSDDTVICTAPPLEHGEYSVAVSNNGIDVEGGWGEHMFVYAYRYSLPGEEQLGIEEKSYGGLSVLREVSPPFGNSGGGTVVALLLGQEPTVRSLDDVSCRFTLRSYPSSTQDVPATCIHATMCSCTSPAMGKDYASPMFELAEVHLVSMKTTLPISTTSTYFFKPMPAIKAVSPSVGSIEGGTVVRVVSDASGAWFNYSTLACYFEDDKGKATWISATAIDCISPASRNWQDAVTVSVSDNGVDWAESESTFHFAGDPIVTDVSPNHIFASDKSTLFLTGNGYLDEDEPLCLFRDENDYHLTSVKGIVVSESTVECQVSANILAAPSEYKVLFSNNGGVETGESFAHLKVLSTISVNLITPQSGTSNDTSSISVFGDNLAVDGLPSFCVLVDPENEVRGTSLATVVNETMVDCEITCPRVTESKQFSVGLSLGSNHAMSTTMEAFWCDPILTIVDVFPKHVAVGEETRLNLSINVRDGIPIICHIGRYAGYTILVPALRIDGILSCLSPAFNRPETLTLAVSTNNQTMVHYNASTTLRVVDPIEIDDVVPEEIFGGSEVVIKGSNFVAEDMICDIGGEPGVLLMANETYAVCQSAAYVLPNANALVRLSLKEGPQVNASATITIFSTPAVLNIQPSSGLTSGGTKVIIRGTNFKELGSSHCFFGDVAVDAYVLCDTSIACFAPKTEASIVPVRVTLDGNRTSFGDEFYSYFNPAVISSIHPNIVIEGTEVTLEGERFSFPFPVKCSFGGVGSAPATIISLSKATCTFVASNSTSVGEVPLSLVTPDNQSASYSTNQSIFHHPHVFLESPYHLYGSVTGEETVEFSVIGLSDDVDYDEANLICSFGSVRVPASIEREVVSCNSPPANSRETGNVTLQLHLGSSVFSDNFLTYEYIERPKITHIYPNTGSIDGGTLVKVSGINLLPPSQVSCRFGSTEAYGFLIANEPSLIHCISPSISSTRSVELHLKLDSEWIDSGIEFHFHTPLSVENATLVGHVITVTGSGFPTSGVRLLCKVGGAITDASVLSNTTVNCPLPDEIIGHVGQYLSVSLSFNGVDFVEVKPPLVYQSEGGITVEGLSHHLGPASSKLELNGIGFHENATIYCFFGSVSTRAVFISDTRIQCSSIPLYVERGDVAMVNVSISHGSSRRELSQSSQLFPFYIYSHPKSLGIRPAHGVSAGGTTVEVGSSSLSDLLTRLQDDTIHVDPRCRFGESMSVFAIINGNGDLVCRSPPVEVIDDSTISMPVFISLNGGKDYVDTRQVFHYYQSPTVSTATPDIVWAGEVTEVEVRGSHFVPLDAAACLVDDREVPAVVIDSFTVRCNVFIGEHHAGTIVPLTITMNGVDASNTLPLNVQTVFPMVRAVRPTFASEAGGTVVTLLGHGFNQTTKQPLFIKVGNNEANFHIINDTAATVVAPSTQDSSKSAKVWIGYGESLTDTGFELEYLSPMLVKAIQPPYLYTEGDSRVIVYGENFEPGFQHHCLLMGESDTISTALAVLDNSSLICDINVDDKVGEGYRLVIQREADGETSNAFRVVVTPRYALQYVEPRLIPEVGGQVLSLTGHDFHSDNAHLIACVFADHHGISTSTPAESIDNNELTCVAPPLPIGDAKVYLTRGDESLESNYVSLSIHPICQIFELKPTIGDTEGGTRVLVHGYGFLPYYDTDVLCQFGNDASPADIIDDEIVSCVAPPNTDGAVDFRLVQSSKYSQMPISNNVIFNYHLPLMLLKIAPDGGPSGGGSEVQLFGTSFKLEDGSPVLVRFASTIDPNQVGYAKDVSVISEDKLTVQVPASPSGSDGGMTIVQVSLNGQEYSSGIFYNYTKSSYIHSFYPMHIVENVCFNLTFNVDNLMASPKHCMIDGIALPALRDAVDGTVFCDMKCLQLASGTHTVSLELENHVSVQAVNDLQVNLISFTDLMPSKGPMDGGTNVVVLGGGFEAWNDGQLHCLFGDDFTSARILDDTTIECSSPSSTFEGEKLFYLAPLHQIPTSSSHPLPFTYYEGEVVDSFAPKSGAEGGGTMVRVEGKNFLNTSSLVCAFGVAKTDAFFIDEGVVECETPALPETQRLASHSLPINVPLMISNNGHDFAPAGLFVYHETPEIISIVPSLGTAFTDIAIQVKSRLGWVEKVSCLFGNAIVTASVTSGHTLNCQSPSYDTNNEPDLVDVLISYNGVDFFGDGFTFKYTSSPLIYSLSSVIGLVSGGNVVNVYGKNLISSSGHITCLFGSKEITAVSVSSSEISCMVPAHGKGTVRLKLVLYDPDTVLETYYDESILEYDFIPPIFISSVTPSFGSMRGESKLKIEVNSVPHFEQRTLEHLYCIFGGVEVTRAKVEEATISCVTPVSNTTGTVSLELGFVAYYDDEMKVTLLSSLGAQFHFTQQPSIDSMFPLRGLSKGGSIVTLSGSNLLPFYNTTTRCLFGSKPARVVFVSNEEVKCISPDEENGMSEGLEVKVSINGVDYHRAPSLFNYDDEAIVRTVYPSHGSIRGGTTVNLTVTGIGRTHVSDGEPLLCIVGSDEVYGRWLDDETISCNTPSSLMEMTVMVSVKYADIYAMSLASFTFIEDPIISSFYPDSLPAVGFSTTAIDIFGSGFGDTPNLMCVYASSLPSTDFLDTNHHIVQHEHMIYHNETYIQCPNPPSMELFFSDTNTSWANNTTLLDEAMIELSLKVGDDLLANMAIKVHPVSFVISVYPKSGPRAGGSQVIVEGENFLKTVHLACKFGDHIGDAQYLSSTKVLCTSPRLPSGFGSVVLPVTIANNGVDFSTSAQEAWFEFHEALVAREATPLNGLSSGGTVVTVTLNEEIMRNRAMESHSDATNEDDMPDPFSFESQYVDPVCIFNGTKVVAEVVDMFSISCVSPPSQNDQGSGILFQISGNDGLDATEAGIFVYMASQDRGSLSLEPSHGPKGGGTRVNVSGVTSGPIVSDVPVLCRFGKVVSPAIEVGPLGEYAVCESPPAALNGYASSVQVDISMVGQINVFSEVGVVFRYDEKVSIASLQPSNGQVTGGTVVKLEGGPFYNSTDILCRFGNQLVIATYHDHDEVSCTTPTLGWVDEHQRLSVFTMANKPEIQSITAKVDDYVNEVHTCQTFGTDNPLTEEQVLVVDNEDVLAMYPSSIWAVRLHTTDERRSLPLVLPLSPKVVETALKDMFQMDEITVTQVFETASPAAQRFNITAEADIDRIEVEALCIACSSGYDTSSISFLTKTTRNGTDNISDDEEGRGFRLVAPGGSLSYPLSQHTRWLHHDETAGGMLEALEGLLPQGFYVNRTGPLPNNAYKWDIVLPKNTSFGGETLQVVRTGGAAVKLKGTNASVSCSLTRLGTAKLEGQFKLSFKEESTKPIPHNASNGDIQAALEELNGIGSIKVNSVSTDANNSGSGAYQWHITFDNLKNAGDLPLLTVERPTPDVFFFGTNASIDVSETRKGSSSEVYKLVMPPDAKRFAILLDELEGDALQVGSDGAEVMNNINSIAGGRSMLVESFQRPHIPLASQLSPPYGPASGGNTVTVSGNGFSRSSVCSFGMQGTPTPARFVSNTSIVCIAPKAGDQQTVDVRVSNDRINWSEQSLSYRYLSVVSTRWMQM